MECACEEFRDFLEACGKGCVPRKWEELPWGQPPIHNSQERPEPVVKTSKVHAFLPVLGNWTGISSRSHLRASAKPPALSRPP